MQETSIKCFHLNQGQAYKRGIMSYTSSQNQATVFVCFFYCCIVLSPICMSKQNVYRNVKVESMVTSLVFKICKKIFLKKANSSQICSYANTLCGGHQCSPSTVTHCLQICFHTHRERESRKSLTEEKQSFSVFILSVLIFTLTVSP